MSDPKFLFCVGATKAGTSWLYEQLAAHPECRFRTIKELHYFSMSKPVHFDNAVRGVERDIETVTKRLVGAEEARRPYLERRLIDMMQWREVLLRRKIDIDAYRAYLTEGAEDARLVGDVTPAYALMGKAGLERLTQTSASSRILYLIRDPLSRLWSHVRMVARRNFAQDRFEQASVEMLERILSDDLSGEGKGIVQRGDYASIMPKLHETFGATRLQVWFQEELVTEPGIARLWASLGLSPVKADLERRVHEGRALSLSEDLCRRALAWLRPQYEFVASQFPALPEAWRNNMEKGFA